MTVNPKYAIPFPEDEVLKRLGFELPPTGPQIAEPRDGYVVVWEEEGRGQPGTAWISHSEGYIAIEYGADPDWFHLPDDHRTQTVDGLIAAALNDELQNV